MELSDDSIDVIRAKLVQRMSVREDIFKQNIQNSSSSIIQNLQQVSLQISEQMWEKMLRKVDTMVQETQQQFKAVLMKLQTASQSELKKKEEDQKQNQLLLSDSMKQIPKLDQNKDKNDDDEDAKNNSESEYYDQKKQIIAEAKALIQTDEIKEKDFEIVPNNQKIKGMVLNQIQKSTAANKSGGNLNTYNSAKLPEADIVIKFVQKESYIEVYDLLSITRKKVPTDTKFQDCAATFQIGSNLYVAGGQDAKTQELQSKFLQVQSNGDSYQLAPMNYKRGMLSLTGCEDYMIASGGCDYNDNPFGYVQQFKFVKMSWQDLPSLISPRFGHAACIVFKQTNLNSSVNSALTQQQQQGPKVEGQTQSGENENSNWEDLSDEAQIDKVQTIKFQSSSNQVIYVFCGAICSSKDCNNIERLRGGSSNWQVLQTFMPIHEGRYYLAKVIPNRNQMLLMGGLDSKDMIFFSLDCEPQQAKFNIKNAPDAAFNCPVVMWQNVLFTISDINDMHYELYKMNVDDTFQMLEVTDI